MKMSPKRLNFNLGALNKHKLGDKVTLLFLSGGC